MRVILINPPIDCVLENGNASPVTSYLFYNSAPLGLLYIASVLEGAGHEVAAIDGAAEQLNVEGVVERVRLFKPDVIGIGSFTVSFETTRRLAAELKAKLPDVPIVLGSYHVTLVPDEAMEDRNFDIGVLGEGEHTMLEVVNYYEKGGSLEDIAGICYHTADGLHFTAKRKKFKKLDELPFPARHLLPPNIYRPVPVDEHAFPKFSMVTSRGCPHACAFCQKSRTGYRSHSPGYIVDEIEHLVRDFGVRDIAFVDSLFCANKKRVHAICDEMIRRGVKVSWTCSSRVEVVDKPLLEKMKAAGCWRTRFGVESGSDRVLDFISKGITKEKIRNAITWADEVGLRPKAFFMVGHMPDTRESILETIEFAKSIPLHDVTVQINTILPETPQEEMWKAEGEKWGRVINPGHDEKSFWNPPSCHGAWSPRKSSNSIAASIASFISARSRWRATRRACVRGLMSESTSRRPTSSRSCFSTKNAPRWSACAVCLGPVGLTRLLRNSVLIGTFAACTPANDACETAACFTDRLLEAAPDEVDAIVGAIPDALTRVEALGAALTKRPEISERLCRHLPHGISKHRCDVAADRRHLWVPLDSTPEPVVRAGSGPARSGWTNASVPESSWAQEYRPATECRGEIDSTACVWSHAVRAATEGEADAAARWCSGLPRGSVWRADCFFQAAELLVERSGRSQLDAALDFCGGAGSFRGRCAASVMATLAATAPPSTVGDVVRWAPQLMTMHAMRDWFDDPVMRSRTEDRYTAMMVFAAVGKATEASGDALDGLPSQAAVHIRAALSHRLITQQAEATTLDEAMSMVAAALDRRVASDRYADVQALVVADLWPRDREGESHLAAVSYLGHSRRTVANDPETDTAICVLEAAARAHPAWKAVLEEAKEHPDERVRWTAVRLVEQLEARRLGTEAAQWSPEHAVQTRDL